MRFVAKKTPLLQGGDPRPRPLLLVLLVCATSVFCATFSSTCSISGLLSQSLTDRSHDKATSLDTANGIQEHEGPSAYFYCLCPTLADCAEPCDISITFKDPSNPYNYPDSTWTDARNVMYRVAKNRMMSAELAGTSVEDYSCFMDGDLRMSPNTKDLLLERLAQEKEYKKIIALGFGPHPKWNAPNLTDQYAYWADAQLNCFERRSIDSYLPYQSVLDHSSWHLSQLELIWRVNLMEPFPFKIYRGPEMKAPNGVHSKEYPHGIKAAGHLQQTYFKDFTGCTPRSPFLKGSLNCTYHGNRVYDIAFNETHIPSNF